MKISMNIGDKTYTKDLAQTVSNIGWMGKYAWHCMPKVKLERSNPKPKAEKKLTRELSGYIKYRNALIDSVE